MRILWGLGLRNARIALAIAATFTLPQLGIGQQSCSVPAVISPKDWQDTPHVSVPASKATFLKNNDTVIGVSVKGSASAYWLPIVILDHRVSDRVGNAPVLVTWCGWCNTGMVFKPEVDGRLLKFDPVGLRGGNMVLKDRETGTGWQQATGQAIAGPLKGKSLPLLPFEITSWARWKALHSGTVAMQPDQNELDCFKTVEQHLGNPFSIMAPEPAALRQDPRLPPHEMILGLATGSAWRAYPLELVQAARIIDDHVGKTPVLILYDLPTDTITAFSRLLSGRTLHFRVGPHGVAEDSLTGSIWNSEGHCIRGELKGQSLRMLTVFPACWFAWAEFYPQTTVFGP